MGKNILLVLRMFNSKSEYNHCSLSMFINFSFELHYLSVKYNIQVEFMFHKDKKQPFGDL